MDNEKMCKCLRCGNVWKKRDYSVNKLPKQCPKCKNPNWNRPSHRDLPDILNLLVG